MTHAGHDGTENCFCEAEVIGGGIVHVNFAQECVRVYVMCTLNVIDKCIRSKVRTLRTLATKIYCNISCLALCSP